MAIKITLTETKERFNHWRTTRANIRTKIPDVLWRNAISLIGNHRVSEIVKTLGLSGAAFREKQLLYSGLEKPKKMGSMTQKKKNILSTADHKAGEFLLNPFVQIPMKQPRSCAATPSSSSITLQRGATQLSLNDPSDDQLRLLINTLFR